MSTSNGRSSSLRKCLLRNSRFNKRQDTKPGRVACAALHADDKSLQC